jgi:sugar phosphate isomerase/epimerase
MLGMSLSYKNLLLPEDEALKPDSLLPKLWDRGVRSVELRAVAPSEPSDNVLKVASLLWDYGFRVTVHGKCRSAESAVSDVFAPLEGMLAHMRQPELTVTVHPIVGDNAEMLVRLSDYITEHRYPVRIALENNRKMPDKTDGNSLALVLDAVERADRENVGICFDMGHFAWYAANFTDSPRTLPPQSFLSRVIHTHIHEYADGTTHFPLEVWREPISLYINALGREYQGIYNVELEPQRFAHRMSAVEGYLLSADTLSDSVSSIREESKFPSL